MIRVVLAVLALVLVASTMLGVAATTNEAGLDGDIMPPIEELLVGSDPTVTDTDGDGIEDGREFYGFKTDPANADTDGDGLPDGVEINSHRTDPTAVDSDGDGIDDGTEVERHGTDPTGADTDGDGLDDAAELDRHGTDPTVVDSDGDGIDDPVELDRHGTDPTAVDTDGDGLDDAVELDRHGTDPTMVDSDGDGIDDPVELDRYGTGPATADTDGDGLGDGAEIESGADPADTDSDNDGVDDGTEVEDGTDPTDPDTDGDGFADSLDPLVDEDSNNALLTDTDGDGLSDAVEILNPELSEANPVRMDVFVEVDYIAGHRPDNATLAMVEDAFADAPIDNPDGSEGITLHVIVGDEIPTAARTDIDELDRIAGNHLDNDDGYHYAVAVADAAIDGRDVGGVASFTNRQSDGRFIFQVYGNDEATASVFMHELGHSLGLHPDQYGGIDSAEIPYTEYRSVMNYDAPSDALEFSSGPPFDDWAYIAEHLYTPPASTT